MTRAAGPLSIPAPVRRKTSPAAAVAGAAALLVVFALLQALVFQLRGFSVATVTASLLGGFLGLVSLAVEIGMVERSARSFHAQGVQTTFLSFVMRLVIVAPLTLLFMKKEMGVDHEAFVVSYCATFFLYLCWLTWETYHAPTCYRPRAQTSAPVVRENSAASAAGSRA